MHGVKPDSAGTACLLEQIERGDAGAVELLLARCRAELRAFIQARLDSRLRARLDPSDVVQETQMELVRRLPHFLQHRPMPFHVWVRRKAYERLVNLRRDHRKTMRRSVEREVGWPEQSSLLLARPFLAPGPSPSEQVAAREYSRRVATAVEELPHADREILLMRHAEELPYEEIGLVLDIEPAAARKRYGRALLRLRQLLLHHGLLGATS
jgi:RNA polymerase sigma-70 factor (ECF subfamily)